MQDFFNAFNFLSQNIHLAGWVFIIGVAVKLSWKISGAVNKFNIALDNLSEARVQTDKMEKTVDLLATNHLPHIQEGLNNIIKQVEKLDENLVSEVKGLRQDLLAVVLHKK
jgi:hypothetical protein